ncbi:MAG: cell division protein FtsL [Gammaproteobacteria bacterium]|uniref:cell division protein FtsL n=1 Tax=Pseudomaricurvus alcaniphilus TaxID=1166482 RepID=UPI00140B1A8F|nr:cell division protein FtsL [Pseudomaricurvus alcaniphilus]MBR9909082.1 cell division protein FtsL [Gammaproteobacteria bacterium]NHN38127.1 cell division protein FtsL [Pseudomaricurvus alcaniphilus]
MRAGETPKLPLLTGLLWLLVIISALLVVRTTHEARTQLNLLEVKKREAAALHVQWGQYLLEQSAWASLGRIEKEATEKLNMVLPQGEQLIVVTP